ncbi:MAG TPA: protein phosphatase 2C domain-containing protein [Gemmatimonadaceae bacterium]|nr:protein phosphatase 2C domain-containing protein [Gemmatimonadaceae bacterium]
MPDEKPLLNQIDVFGATHKGLVRDTNADHFLVASFHRAILVHAASVPAESLPAFSPDSRGFVLLVADGVGSMSHGAHGSARVTDAIAHYLLGMSEVSLLAQPKREQEVLDKLKDTVSAAHLELQNYAREVGGGAATTITVVYMIWPCAFIAHAGDSRAYRLRDGKLERLTTDQTMAQALIDAGTMSKEAAEASRFRNVLLSAVGGASMDLDMSALDLQRNDRWLLCSDGLPKHVTDEEIAAALASDRTSRQVCEHLIDLTLQRGAEDNVTVIATRARAMPGS